MLFRSPKSDSVVNFSWRNNGSRLDSLLAGIRSRQKNAVLHRVSLISGSSPEGDSTFNKRLSDKRLASLRSSIQECFSAPDSVFVFSSLGEDWNGLSSLVEGSNCEVRERNVPPYNAIHARHGDLLAVVCGSRPRHRPG